jgi:hypothetical protein
MGWRAIKAIRFPENAYIGQQRLTLEPFPWQRAEKGYKILIVEISQQEKY